MSKYDTIAGLVDKIRSARYGEMVRYLETLIDYGDWLDFTTPVGFRFRFRSCEFDYFLIAMEVDPTIVRHAYACALDVDDLAVKQFRLADITGSGRLPGDERRPWKDVVAELVADPGGTAQRIKFKFQNGQKDRDRYVYQRTAQMARDPKRRKAAERGQRVRRDSPKLKRWEVRWSDDKTAAEAITTKLLTDEVLARDVYKRLHAKTMRDTRLEDKRRSGA